MVRESWSTVDWPRGGIVNLEYKCVAGPTIVAVKSAKARDQAVKAFEEIMNREAAGGWEFVGIDEFHVSEPQGLFSRKRVYVPAKILVFRRIKDMPDVQLPEEPAMTSAGQVAAPSLPLSSSNPIEMPGTAGEESRHSIKAIADNLQAKRKA
jgi:hypothetical protein